MRSAKERKRKSLRFNASANSKRELPIVRARLMHSEPSVHSKKESAELVEKNVRRLSLQRSRPKNWTWRAESSLSSVKSCWPSRPRLSVTNSWALFKSKRKLKMRSARLNSRGPRPSGVMPRLFGKYNSNKTLQNGCYTFRMQRHIV